MKESEINDTGMMGWRPTPSFSSRMPNNIGRLNDGGDVNGQGDLINHRVRIN